MNRLFEVGHCLASWRGTFALKPNFLLLVLCGGLGGCVTPGSVEQDGLVTKYERLPVLPTGGEREVLIFRGKKYSPLYSEGYVKVPELDGIIFATRRGDRNVKLHFVPMHGNGEVIVDEGEVWFFGLLLGRPRDHERTQYVESVSGRKVTFFSTPTKWEIQHGHPGGHRYIADLDARKFWKVGHSGTE